MPTNEEDGDVWRSVSDFFLVQNEGIDVGRRNASRDLDFFRTIGRFVVDPRWIFIMWLEFIVVYMLAQQIANVHLVALTSMRNKTRKRPREQKRPRKHILHWLATPQFEEEVGLEILSCAYDDDDGLPVVVAANAYDNVPPRPACKSLSKSRPWHISFGSILPDKTTRGMNWSRPMPTITHPVFKYLFKYANGDEDG